MSNRLWIAKLGPGNDFAYECWNNNFVGVGWSLEKSQLKEIQDCLPDKQLAKLLISELFENGKTAGNLHRLIVEADNGDFVLVGPIYWTEEEDEQEKKSYIIGKITSDVFIQDDDNIDYFRLIRKTEWGDFTKELPSGMKDYIGRNRNPFAFAENSMLSYEDINKIFKGGTFDEYKKLNKSYEALSKSIIEYLSSMDASNFEEYIRDLLNNNGWDVETTPKSGDKGVDVVGVSPLIGNIFTEVIVQVKSYKKSISKNLIKEFQLEEIPTHYNLENPIRVFITTSSYTNSARKQSNEKDSHPIILIDGQELADLVIFSDMIPGIHWPDEEVQTS